MPAWIRRKRVHLIVLLGAVALVIACGSGGDGDASHSSTPVTGTPNAAPSTVPPATAAATTQGTADEVATPAPDSGFLSGGTVEFDRVVEAVLWPTADGTVGPWACEADAIVGTEDGVVSNPTLVPGGFDYEEGEPVFDACGEPIDQAGYMDLPVHRDEVGMLILGWRVCEEDPDYTPGPTAEPIP